MSRPVWLASVALAAAAAAATPAPAAVAAATPASAAAAAATPAPPAAAAPAAAPGSPSAAEGAPLVRLSAARLERPWVEATPLAWGSAAKVLVPARPAATVALVDVPPGMAMVCAGAEGRAPRCQRALLAKGRVLELAEPLPGVRITGRLLLGRSPLAGRRLAVAPAGLAARRAFTLPLARRGDGGSLLREVRSGADGRFAIPQLAPGEYVLEARAAGSRDGRSGAFTVPDPARLRRNGDDPAGPPTLDLGDWSLAEGVPLAVRVVDWAGAPIAGAEVAALQDDAGAAESVSAARTGADGRATLDRLDAAAAVQIHCSAAGYVAADEELARVPVEARCALARRASLAGRVVGDDDRPIAAATLTLERAERSIRRSAASDPAGAFAFADLAAGRYRLVAAAPGRRAIARAVEIAAGERGSAGVLRLAPADRLWGQLVDAASGDPLPGAAVAVVEPAGGGSATTDDEGRFGLAAGAELALRLELRAPGFPVKRVEVDPELHTAEAAPLVVGLSRGGRVQIGVWDERTDAPCLGCTVQLVGQGMEPVTLTTDAGGEATSEPLDPGAWDAYLETAESVGSTVRVHSDAVRPVTVVAGTVSRLDFGRHATLVVRFSSPLPPGWMVAASGDSFRSTAAAGADGTFAVRRPDGEAITLAVVDGALHRVQQAVVPAGYGDPALALPLPAASVRGVLMRGDEPGRELQVSLAGSPGGGELASALADGNGAFEIPFLPAGIYSLAVEGRPVQTVEVRDGQPLDLGAVQLPR